MAKKTPEQYLKEPYARVLVPEDTGGYYAEILEFPGCLASGKTPSEAYTNLEAVALEWIKAEQEEDHEIPLPSAAESFSGKFALRLPRGLHQQAARMAERDGTSLNQYFVTAIAARVGADDLYHRMAQREPWAIRITGDITLRKVTSEIKIMDIATSTTATSFASLVADKPKVQMTHARS